MVARDIEDYQRILLDRLAKIKGIANYKSTLVVRDVKRSTELPICFCQSKAAHRLGTSITPNSETGMIQ